MSFKIKIWKGHHSAEVFQLIKESWEGENSLLILCPPQVKEVSEYFPFLPSGEVSFYGELKEKFSSFINKSTIVHKKSPRFGLFSSGTSDKEAKLILYTKKNFLCSLKGILSFYPENKITHVYSYPQPYHVFGLSLGYLLSLNLEIPISFSKGAYKTNAHKDWVMASKKEGAGLLTLGAPTHFKDLINYIKENNLAPGLSYSSIIGGASVSKKLWLELQKVLKIKNPSIGYGFSEASPGVTHLGPGICPEDDNEIGKALPNIKIEKTGDGYEVIGENICSCIIQAGEISFPQNKYLVPDNIVKKESGYFWFNDRKGNILNRGGEKFSLTKIENYLKNSLNLNVVALSLKDARLGEDLGLLIEGAFDLIDKELEIKELLMNQLKGVFNRRLNPKNLKITRNLPMNSNMKLDKNKCLELFIGEV